MKTTYTPESITSFLKTVEHAIPDTIEPLAEGHLSQAYKFETNAGDKRVLRISINKADFLADIYAAEHFGAALLVPKAIDLKQYDDDAFYCVTELVSGKTSNTLSDEEMQRAQPSIQQVLASIYRYDISSTSGYGHINTVTGNARYQTWNKALSDEIEDKGLQSFRNNAQKIGLNPDIADRFFGQFRENLQYASEVRALLHGDPAFDNMLIDNDTVTAVIDWAQVGYGDWVSDYARLDFWWPKRYGDIKVFAERYQLDSDNLEHRVALYWATNALWTIEFADKASSDSITEWLKEHISEKLI